MELNKLSNAKLLQILELQKSIKIDKAKTNLYDFGRYIYPNFSENPFHKIYYEILDLFAKGKIKKLIVSVPPQHGKALHVDTPILTSKGWKKHGDLKRGDFVFGKNGDLVKVLNNFGSQIIGSSIGYFSGSEKLIASNNHEWEVLCDREKYRKKGIKTDRIIEILETQNLFKGQRRNPCINADIKLSIEQTTLPIDPYILGCWLGVGTNATGILTCGEEDINHFCKLGKKIKRKSNYYSIRIENLSKLLRLNNLINNKHIPINYLLSSHEQRLELLRGLMDTDGCVDSCGRCEFTQKSGQLGKDIYVLLRSLGIKPTRATYDMKLNGKKVGIKDRIFFSQPNEIVFKLQRKIDKQKFEQRIDSKRFFIESIENIGLQSITLTNK